MTKKFDINSMFDAIKGGLADNSVKPNSIDYSNFLKCEVGKTYTVRIIPFVGDPAKTFYHFIEYGWTSKATDQYVSAVSPSSIGEPCPIKPIWTKGFNKATNKNESGIGRREQWLVNVYVIDDPTNPENNGTIKILKYGKQLNTVIAEAFADDFRNELGPAVYDLSANGFNLNVKVTKQQDYANYTQSSFARRPSAIPGVSDNEDKIVELYESVFDLKSFAPIKSYDALKKMLDEHYFVGNQVSTSVESPKLVIEDSVSSTTQQETEVVNTVTTTTDDELDALIADL